MKEQNTPAVRGPLDATVVRPTPRCDECLYCWPHEEPAGEEYVWAYHCNLAVPGGKDIDKEDGEDTPAWCPLLPHNARLTAPDTAQR